MRLSGRLGGMGEPPEKTARVLVVDDDEMTLELVRMGLEKNGHSVVAAGDGIEAMTLLAGTTCDMVVSDVDMPRLNGLGLVERLRAQSATADLPIILMTALSAPEDAIRALRAGADDYVRKPFDLHELMARVQAKLERPPVVVPDLTEARRIGVLTSQRLTRELQRELDRSSRSQRPLALAVLQVSEYATVVDRYGRHAGADLLSRLAQVAQAAASPLDLAGLLPSIPGDDSGRLALLMPETSVAEADTRLAKVAATLTATPFEVRGEDVHVTPVSGWASSADTPRPKGARELLDRAQLAAHTSAAHLDLLPLRWTAELERAPEARGSCRRDRLRTPAQIAATFVLGVIAPFFVYVGLYEAGVDLSAPLYIAVVFSLAITALFIWLEGVLALRPERPPPEPADHYPKATALIAAYLPNEAATVIETVKKFLLVDYPGELQVVLAYNTPGPMPIEEHLNDLARSDPRFVPFRVHGSTSKAQNVNAALAIVDGVFTGVFDADHHPEPSSFERAWRWLANGYDVVQGHCQVRNGDASTVARTVAIEFEAIYAVSHPGRAKLHGFGIFGGSNGYWRTPLLRETRMQGAMLTEDIDSSMRVLLRGRRIAIDPELVSRELAPTTVSALWHQRMRWAQGWFQVSRRHIADGWRSPEFSLRNKLGLTFLLGWREVYPWLSMQMFPLIAFLAWREGGVANLDWVIPVFVLTTMFTASVGPGQVLFAYRLAVPELRERRRWFVWYLVVASLLYTEFKNIIARVAQVKEFMGEKRWVITPRTLPTESELKESA